MRLADKFRPSWFMRRFAPFPGAVATELMNTPRDWPDGTLGTIGSLEVRLARNTREVRLAQALRYHVFYREMSAQTGPAGFLRRRDVDGYDAICDHLLVIDHEPDPEIFTRRRDRRPAVVGTYRLLRQDVAEQHGGFYTATEFDVSSLVERKRPLRFLELGRSCVLKPYRGKRVVELLWAGNWAYVQHYAIDAMIGCASLEGTGPDRFALPLSFLHHYARAPEDWRVSALPDRYVEMNRIPAEAIDQRAAMNALPPLLKGYLRLGATVGDGAVIDHQFGTTDVCVILPVSAINPRYYSHFGPPKAQLF